MKNPYNCQSSSGSARIRAKIRLTVTVVVNGSPIPSVTGRLPRGGSESRAMSLLRLRCTRLNGPATAGVSRCSASSTPATVRSWVAVSRALC